MNQTQRRIIRFVLLLCITFLLTMVVVLSVSAETETYIIAEIKLPYFEGYCGRYMMYGWDFETGTLEILGFEKMYDYSGYCARPWSSHLKEIKSVIISDTGIENIGENAFEGCTNLTSVTIPKGLTSIGDGAFCGCINLTSVTIPKSVTSIGDRAFYGCSKLQITVPKSVTYIGKEAFEGCSKVDIQKGTAVEKIITKIITSDKFIFGGSITVALVLAYVLTEKKNKKKKE